MDLFKEKSELYCYSSDGFEVTDDKILNIRTCLVKEVRQKSCLYAAQDQSTVQ